MIRLWTWQNPDFKPTDVNVPYDPRKHSRYYNDPTLPKAKEAYEEIWKRLGSCQVIWFYTRKENAVSFANREYAGNVLWRLDVPEEYIRKKGKKICSVAWHWLLSEGNCFPPEVFDKYYSQVKKLSGEYHLHYSRNQFVKDVNSYWRETPWCQLWDVLFTDCVAEECWQIILQHPVDGTWIKEEY